MTQQDKAMTSHFRSGQNLDIAKGTTATDVIEAVRALVHSELAPISAEIDQRGRYPIEFLGKLAELGGFAAATPVAAGGTGLGLATQIDIMTEVGRECGSTAFLVWCQTTCARYLQHAPNAAARDRYLKAVCQGEILAGTGMSNTVKHLAGIENIHLKARRAGDAYVVSGALPWVSNIGTDHLIIVAAAVEDGGYVMFAVRGDATGLTLRPCPQFAGLEGTQTLNIRMKDVHIPAEDVLAHPKQFAAFMTGIKPAFVLGQLGMGFGIIEGSLRTIRESNVTTAHVNQFLDDQDEELSRTAGALIANAHEQAALAEQGKATMLDVLRLRLAASELTLRVANSAVLHAGAKGYLMRHPAQRRLREAVFVAIVTPALKHLRKEIHALEHAAVEEQTA